MIRRLFTRQAWPSFHDLLAAKPKAASPLRERRALQLIEVLEARVAPATTVGIVGGNTLQIGDNAGLNDDVTVTITGGNYIVTSTSGVLVFGGATMLDANTASVPVAGIDNLLAHTNAISTDVDTLSINSPLNLNGQIILTSDSFTVTNPMTSVNSVVWIDAHNGGITVNAPLDALGGFDLNAQAGDVTINANMSGDGNFFLKASGSIVVNGGVDLTHTGGAAGIVIDSDRDNSGGGGFFVTAPGTLIDTGGGPLTIGGGGSPGSQPARGTTDKGVYITGATITTNAGDLNIRGAGDNTSGGGSSIGVDLVGTSITTSSGNITIAGTGGAVTDGFTMGVSLFSGTSVTTATGAINITGSSNATGSDAHGVKFETNSKVEATGNGSITISGTAGTGSNSHGVAVFSNGDIVSQGSGAISITGAATNGVAFNTTSGANDVQIGKGPTGTYSGALTISANTISISNNASLQSTGALVLQPVGPTTAIGIGPGATGTFNLDATEVSRLIDGFSSITFGRSDGNANVDVRAITFTDPATIRVPAGGTITVNGQITGSGNASITLDGAGATTVLVSNIVTAGNPITISDSVQLDASVALDTTNAGGTPAGASISIAGTINLGANTLTYNAGATTNSIAGVISGTGGGLTKAGTGTLTLTATGANTYTGTTNVNAGVLNIQNNTSLGTSAGGTVVASGAALQVQGSITVTGESLTINGNGIANDGALRSISGNNTWTGAITATPSGGFARIFSDAGSLAINTTIALGGVAGDALVLGGAGNGSVTGAISGLGGLIKSATGAGTWTLSGASTYGGPTTISSGTLQLAGGADRLPVGTSVTLGSTGSGATFDLNGQNQSIAALTLGVTGGAGAFAGNVTTGAGTLTVNGAITTANTGITNSHTISGNLSLGGATRTITVVNGGSANDLIVSAGVSNGSITKQGAGTLQLSGNNSISGTTTITQGVVEAVVDTAINPLGTSTASVDGGTLRFNRTAALAAGIDRHTITTGVNNVTALTDFAVAGTDAVDTQVNRTSSVIEANRWRGLLNVTGTGNYTFRVRSDDGARLYVDGVLVVNNEGPHGAQDRDSLAVTLSAGLHSIELLHSNGGSAGSANLQYSGPDQATMGLIPAARLFRSVPVALGNNVTVTANGGTIETAGNLPGLTLGNLNLSAAGTTNVTFAGLVGPSLDFASTTFGASGTTANLTINNALKLGQISDGANTGIVLNKAGTGRLTLDNNAGGGSSNDLSGTTLRVTAGRVINIASNVAGTSIPLDGATIELNGGILALDTKVGNYALTNPITVSASSEIEMMPGGVTFTHQTGTVTINTGTLTLDTFRGSAQTAGASLTFLSNIGGAGALTKTSTQTNTQDAANVTALTTVATLSGTNTYQGQTTVSSGRLTLTTSTALGNSSGDTTVASGAQLQLQGNITIPAGEVISINGTGINNNGTGALRSDTGNNAVTDQVALTGNAMIVSAAAAQTLTLTGGISLGANRVTFDGNGITTLPTTGAIIGTGSVTKQGAGGTVSFAGNSTYSGTTDITGGILQIRSANALGTAAGITAIASGATVQFDATAGSFAVAEPFLINGTGAGANGALQSIAGNVTLNGPIALSADATIGNIATGTTLSLGNTISKENRANLTFTGAGGITAAGNIDPAAFTIAPITARWFDPVTLAIDTDAGINSVTGGTPPATVATGTLNTALSFANDAAFAAFFGVAQPADNTFTAVFFSTITIATPGVYTFAASNNDDGAVVWLDLDGDNTFELAGGERLQSVGINNTGIATATLAAGTYRIAYGVTDTGGESGLTGRILSPAVTGLANATLLPVVNPTAGTDQLTKNGSGTVTLGGTNTYTGLTNVNAGTLLINGSTVAGSAFTVGASGTLGGTGTIAGTVNNSGTIAPGTSPGQIDTGSFTFATNSIFNAEFGGTTPGDGSGFHDQINVTGTVNIGSNVALNLASFGGFTPTYGQSFNIISNDGSDPVIGTFNGLPEGASIVNFLGSGLNATITYAGGTNSNDVVITTAAGETDVAVSAGNLVVTDINGGTTNDTLTLSLVNIAGTDYVRINDPANILYAGSGTLQIDPNTVDVVLSTLTGITLDTLGGNDQVTLNLGSGSFLPTGGLTYNGGTAGNDILAVLASSAVQYTPSATTNGDGSISVAGSSINFTGLEPVDFDFVVPAPFSLILPAAADVVNIANGLTVIGGLDALVLSGTSGGVGFETAHVRDASSILIDTTTVAGTDTITLTSASNGHNGGALTITTGAEADDIITVNGTATFTGTTTLNAATINLNANVTNAVTGTTATTINVAAPGQIQDGINVAAAAGATVTVGAGSFPENLILTKQLTLRGAQFGVDARGRVVGAPNPAVETVVAPAGGIALELQTGSNAAIIDGIAFVGSLSGATGVVGNTSSTNTNLNFSHNYVAVAAGFTASAIFMNRPAVDATFNQNEFIASATSAQAVFFDGADAFHGLQFTNNNLLRNGAPSGTGLFVDGNHNVSNTGSVNTPLIKGNLIQGFATGANLGSRSFDNGEISENTFTGNTANGLQGGPQHTLITRNTFNNTGTGIAFTSFGNLAADRGAQFDTVTNNFFLNNATADILVSATQPVGVVPTTVITNNSFASTVKITYAGTEQVRASGNWFGSNVEATVNASITGAGAVNVDRSPFLDLGTDTDLVTPGFQGDFSALHTTTAGTQFGATGRINEAVGLLTNGSLTGQGRTIHAWGGTYAEAVNLSVTSTLNLISGNVTVGSLTGIAATEVKLGTNTLLTGNDGSTTSYPGVVSGVGGGLTKQGGGTFTLSNTNTYSGTTLISAGTLSITGSISGSAVTVGSTGTLAGTGTTGAVTVNSGGFVAPGISPGILNTGSVGFTGSSTLTVEVNGNVPGTQHDQLNVTGTVALGGATLSSSGTIASSAGQTVVLINNDGADAVTGTFAGLPEGNTVTINGINFAISYSGGTGNDVVLFEGDTNVYVDGSGNLVIDDVNSVSNDDLTIQSNTGASVYVINNPGLILYTNIPGATGSGTSTLTVPFAPVTGPSILVNTFGGNDSLTVNFALGNFGKIVTYDGGTQTTSDSLTLSGGGTFTNVAHTFLTASSGNVGITGNSLINYVGLEPVIDNLSATNRLFDFTGAAETITVVDVGGADGNSQIDSTLGESVNFTNPTASLEIRTSLGAAGADSVSINSIDAAYRASTIVTTDNGDTVNLNTALTLGSATSAGNFTVATASAFNLNASISTDAAANAGSINVTGSTRVGANVVLDTDATTTDGTVTFNSSIDDDASGGSNRTFTITSGTAAITLAAPVGASQALDTFTITSASTASVQAVTATTGGLSITAGSIALGGTQTTSGGGHILLNSTGAGVLPLNQSLAAGGGIVRLLAGAGGINQTAGAITGSALGIVSAGAVTANSATNNVSTLAANLSAGAFAYTDANMLDVGVVGNSGAFLLTNGVSANGNVTINAGGLTLTRDINTPANVFLNSSGTIAEIGGAVLNAALLDTDSVGGQTMIGGNTVLSFNASNTTGGNVTLTNTATTLAIVRILNPAGDTTVINTGNVQLGDGTNQNINVSGIASITAAGVGNSISDGNTGTNNITALAAILSANAGVAAAANELETNITNLEAQTATGGVFINEANTLTIGAPGGLNGVSATTSGDIEINSGALSIAENIAGQDNIFLTAAGAITESTGAITTPDTLNAISNGGQTLNNLGNAIGTYTATNTGAGTAISLQNNFGGFTISTVTNQTGGNVFLNNAGTNATITGIITSGNPVLGGDITVQTAGLLTVNNTVDSRGGSGGTLTLGGLLTLNVSPLVGFGDVTLQGGAGPLTINAPISVASPLVLQSTEDVNILAKVETTSVTADITVLADLDNNGTGGVLIADQNPNNPAPGFTGSLKAGRNLDVRGSEYLGSYVPALALLDNSVMIQSSVNANVVRLEAVGNVLVKNNTGAPTDARIWLGGLVRSNTNGDVAFDNAVLLTGNEARALSHGDGDVIFLGAIDSAAGVGSPFNLRASTDNGVVLFNGAVGTVNPAGDVTVDAALDVTVAAAFNARSFTVTTASGTVDLGGPVTTTGTGTNLAITANHLLVNAAVNSTAPGLNAGSIVWEVENLTITANTAGDGTLTIQPITVGRSIGINGVGLLNLTTAEVGLIQNGFAGIQIGRSNGSGTITTDGVTFLDPVSILSPAAGGVINVNGTIAGTGDASIFLQAPTLNFDVAPAPVLSTETRAITTVGNIILLDNALLDSAVVGDGFDISHTGTINGAFDFTADADSEGNITIQSVAGAGVGVGGSAPLDSFTLIGGNIDHHSQTVTTGPQTYTATGTINVYSNDLSSTFVGPITFNGNVALNESLLIKTSGIAGANVVFNGTLDSAPLKDGAVRINAGSQGNVNFVGAVGDTNPVNKLEVLQAGTATIGSTVEVETLFGLKATEVNFNGGVASVLAGSLTIEPLGALLVRVGGAADSGATTLDLTQTDIAAIAGGTGVITIVGASINGIEITSTGATFASPAVFRQAIGSGAIEVDGPLTAEAIEFHAGVTRLAANVTTTAGAMLFDTNVELQNHIILTAAGGDFTVNGIVQDTGAGAHNLTVNAGSGNVLFKNQLGRKNTPSIGQITLNSTGATAINSSVIAQGFASNAGGSTEIRKTMTISGPSGIVIGDDVLLSAASTLNTTGGGPITIAGDIDSLTSRQLTLNLRSTTGNITVNGSVGAVNGLYGFNVRTNGDVTVAGAVTAQGSKIQGDALAIDDVAVTKTLTIRGATAAFNGALTAAKLTMNIEGSIVNTAPWQVTGIASLRSSLGSITVNGAGNDFGSLKLRGSNGTIETDGTLNLLTGTRLNGTADLTSNTGSIIGLGSFRASTLTADAAAAITLNKTGVRISSLGVIDAGTGITIFSAGTNLSLNGVITNANGDVFIGSDAGNSRGNITNNVGAGAIIITGAGRWVLYSYSVAGTNLNGLATTFIEIGKRPPTAPGVVNTGNGVIYAI